MAKKHSNTLLWVALLGGGAYLWYTKGQTTTTTTTTSLPTDTAGGPTIAPPVNAATIINPSAGLTTAAVGPTPTTGAVALDGSPLPSGISQVVYNTVYTWAYADGRAPVKAMANALIPSEYLGMYDIITTEWGLHRQPTTAQTAFWNNLRDKYDPSHVSW